MILEMIRVVGIAAGLVTAPGGTALATANAMDDSGEDDPRLVDCSADEFDQRRLGHPVFVAWFHATWCPTCLRQHRVLRELLADGVAGDPLVCRFDFDAEPELRQQLGVAEQSTLIRFRNGTETSRSRGETKPPRLRAFLEGP
ncbi:MAG: thioredoxin family protein [Myxococcales bacterium FL481]|nr:MAG: thioredoxin family protein [Myxococcales bacterium FL481]